MFELESLLSAMRDAGLELVEYRTPLGCLLAASTGEKKGREGLLAAGREKEPRRRARLRILRSPAAGVRGPCRRGESETVEGEGAVLASVTTLLGEEEVSSPGRGAVARWLREEGSMVGYGEALAWWKEDA